MDLRRRGSDLLIIGAAIAALIATACSSVAAEGRQARAAPSEHASKSTGWTTYTLTDHRFRVEIPSEWTKSIAAGTHNPAPTLSFEDPRRRDSGDPGSVQYPLLAIRVEPVAPLPRNGTSSVRKPLDEVTVSERSQVVSGQPVVIRRYVVAAAESASQVTYLLTVGAHERTYTIEYSYTLAGCSNVGEAFRARCTRTNTQVTRESEQVFSRVLRTFTLI
jgi:hypothetical protein